MNLSEVIDIFQRAFDPTGFPPRWYCGTWSSSLGWLHIFSDVLIFLSYIAIPSCLLYFVRNRPQTQFATITILFSSFIICCGIGHLLEAIIFWLPIYRFAGLWKLCTALVSLSTAIAIIPLIPIALRLPGIVQANKELRQALGIIKGLRSAQGEMAYRAAHCLKEPVRSIHFRLSHFLETSSTISQDLERELKSIQDQSQRLHEMIEDMVTYANIMSMDLNPSTFDVGVSLKKIIQELLGDRISPLRWPTTPQPLKTDQKLFHKAMTAFIKHTMKNVSHPQKNLQFSLNIDDQKHDIYDCTYEFCINMSNPTLSFSEQKEFLSLFSERTASTDISVAARIIQRLGGKVELKEDSKKNQIVLILTFQNYFTGEHLNSGIEYA